MKKVKPLDVIFIVCVTLFILIYWLFIKNLDEDHSSLPLPISSYKGIITMWDTPVYSSANSKFAFINAVNDKFLENKKNVLFDMTYLTSPDSFARLKKASAEKKYPDIMRYYVKNETIDEKNIQDNLEFSQSLSNFSLTEGFCAHGGKMVVDIAYSVNVLMVNEDALKSAGLDMDSFIIDQDTFLQSLEKLKSWDKKNAFRLVDFDTTDPLGGYMPLLTDENGNIDYGLISKIKQSYWKDHTIHEKNCEPLTAFSSFQKGESIFYFTTLSRANMLLNRALSFQAKVCLFTKGSSPYVFVNDIVSYAGMKSDDAKKNAMIEDYLLYLCGNDVSKFIDQTGLLAVFKTAGYKSKTDYINNINDITAKRLFFNEQRFLEVKNSLTDKVTEIFGKSE